MAILNILAILATCFASTILAQRKDGQFFPCNPLTNGTGVCNPNIGLPKSEYFMDFTQRQKKPKDWTISNNAEVWYGVHGAQFSFKKRYDAPQLWTDFYILFGSVETVMEVAPGKSIISSSVLISDSFDEIDWEFSGNNFGNKGSRGMGQNNYFGKGITGNYDRGSFFNLSNPQGLFHTYKVDWTPEKIVWSINGKPIRTLLNNNSTTGAYQFPQSPCKVQLGLWNGGDPDNNARTREWAGGTANLTQLENSGLDVTFYVKSIKITNVNPAYGYNYTDTSGKWESIQLLQTKPNANGTWDTTSTSTKTPKPTTSKSSSTTGKSQTSTKKSSSSSSSSTSTRPTTSTRSSSTSTRTTRTSSTSSSSTRSSSTRPRTSSTSTRSSTRPPTRPTTSSSSTRRPTTTTHPHGPGHGGPPPYWEQHGGQGHPPGPPGWWERYGW